MEGVEPVARRGLDFAVVLEAFAGQARTSMGEAAVRALQPLADRASAVTAMDTSFEVLRVEDAGGSVPVGSITDIRSLAARASKGTVLEGAELLQAGHTLESLIHLRTTLDGSAEEAPRLARIASAIAVDPFVARTLLRAFEPNGQLSGATYPELDELRKGIARLHDEVRGTLDRLVKGEELGDDLLQDRFWTVRNDRYVLPIKSHAKRWNLGIVHDTSGTGATVFVEPHEVIELNNRLRLAEGRLKAAEHAILAALSRELGTDVDAIRGATEAAVEIDLACARAGLARRLRAIRPEVGEGERITALAARHPVLVLRGVDVVANDLQVGGGKPVLVLSGPNAGGKTVALKTLGLFAELVRHGCAVPAGEGTRVDFFADVAAVIGDQQTVEGDLSSFSAHLVALEQLLDEAAPGQLVLLDEIASGTDPAQGSALARAILEDLAERGPRVVVTTHFGALKGLAAVDGRFATAAVQYAEGKPTYRVLAGATGESHALSIAERVGIPQRVLDRATDLLGQQELELSRLLAALEEERSRAEVARAEVERAHREAEEATRSVQRREEELRRRAAELEKRGAAAFLDRLRNAEKAVGQVVAELQRNPSHEGVKAAKATLSALSALAPAQTELPSAPSAPSLAVGDRVRHRKLGSVGEVVSLGDQVEVRAGALTFRARPEDLEPLKSDARRTTSAPIRTTVTRVTFDDALRMPGNTLDLRGKRVDEGQDEAERFFDRAVRSGQDTVFLLHGHGTGALKDGLRGWLRSSAYVSDWAAASEEQGGDAFTVVRLA
ncbi:MAG: Smr/MutS family protein [Alphaproteobacteria bacterium]|nr:Smr/MutS family protein [Alphaproteobacteria bacterium]